MTRYIPILSIVAAAIVGSATPAPAATAPLAVTASATLAARDTGDSLWRRAREALSDGDYDRAAELFGAVRDRFPRSAFAGDSYYWQAFAMSRDGSQSRLRRALELLTEQAAQHAAAGTVKSGEARTLATRLRGQLARSGDADAAAAVAERAREISRSAGAAVAAGDAMSDRDRAQATRDQREAERNAAQAGRSIRSIAYGFDRGRSATPPGCKNEDEDDRVEALNALLQMNAEQAVPILKKVLDRRDPCSELLRRKAVFLVSQKRSEETADILLKAAKTDPDAETRDQAIFWLSQVSGEKAEEFLLGILKESKDEEVQKRALFSLSQRRSEKSQAALREYASRADAPAELRQQAVFWLGQRKSEENARFLRDLFARTTDDDVREKVLFSLSQMRGMGNETFILDQAANTKLPIELRKQALFWAAQGTGVSTAQLSAIYDKNPDAEMREQVIFTLSQRGNRDTAAVDKLLDIARNEKDRELRKKAIFWLGQSKDPRAAKLLQELIDR
ncbi:MAG: HEAT repeat domain-containing protein [Gemmatimonadaceae bacterium]